MEYISNCFQKLKPQSEEEAIKQKRLIAYVAIAPFITSILMVSIGFMSNNDYDCPGSEAPKWLMIGGSVQAASSVIKFYYLTQIEKLHQFARIMHPLLDLTYFCLAIWGAVKVFGKLHHLTILTRMFEMCCITGAFGEWTSEDITSEHYCSKSAFSIAMGSLIGYWTLMPLSICAYCFYHICCKKSNKAPLVEGQSMKYKENP